VDCRDGKAEVFKMDGEYWSVKELRKFRNIGIRTGLYHAENDCICKFEQMVLAQ
jgi:hypothetical protein